MNRHLSPKDLATVIGVSESSLKRWVDEGRLIASRTAGGHRRIALHEAIRFIRDTNQTLARPELLGLTDLNEGPLSAVSTGAGEVALLHALETGHAETARGLIMAQYLSARSFAGVCDGPIAHSMHRIGELWRHSDNGIMVEHRATEIVIDSIHQIRHTIPPAAEGSPVAIGSAAPGDPYVLPSLMAATTLLECGYNDVNLGPNLPIESMISAVKEHNPRLAWISVSTMPERAPFLDAVQRLAQHVNAIGAVLVLGGRGIYGTHIGSLPSTHLVASMSELAALGRTLRLSPRPQPDRLPPPGPLPTVGIQSSLIGGSMQATAQHPMGKARPKR